MPTFQLRDPYEYVTSWVSHQALLLRWMGYRSDEDDNEDDDNEDDDDDTNDNSNSNSTSS